MAHQRRSVQTTFKLKVEIEKVHVSVLKWLRFFGGVLRQVKIYAYCFCRQRKLVNFDGKHFLLCFRN